VSWTCAARSQKALNRSDASQSLSFSFEGPFLNCCYEPFQSIRFGFSNAGFAIRIQVEHAFWLGRTLLIHGVTSTSRSGAGPQEPCRSGRRPRTVRRLSGRPDRRMERIAENSSGPGAAAKLATRRRGCFRRGDASAAPHRAVWHRRRGLPTCCLRPSRVDPGPTPPPPPRHQPTGDHHATAPARRPLSPPLYMRAGRSSACRIPFLPPPTFAEPRRETSGIDDQLAAAFQFVPSGRIRI
jgi:hypothetical protein